MDQKSGSPMDGFRKLRKLKLTALLDDLRSRSDDGLSPAEISAVSVAISELIAEMESLRTDPPDANLKMLEAMKMFRDAFQNWIASTDYDTRFSCLKKMSDSRKKFRGVQNKFTRDFYNALTNDPLILRGLYRPLVELSNAPNVVLPSLSRALIDCPHAS